jgi:GPH family glycoside/pentoside/hexuronide:cation symporter
VALDPLPLRTKLLYSASSTGGEAITQSRGLWLLFFYALDEGSGQGYLPLGLVGALLFAGRLLEALNDPLIAYWSDRTRSRLGRRLPFVLLATPLWALFAFLLFVPPEDAGVPLTAVYFFVVLELFFLFATLSGGPYEALLPEIARTSDERLSVVGIRVYFGAAGGAIGVVASGVIVDAYGFGVMALTMAAIALVARYAGMAGVWRRASRTQAPAAIPFRVAVRATVSNPHFQRFLPTFVLFQTALQMLLGVLPFLVVAVLGAGAEGTWVSILSAAALGTTLAVVPFFVRAARRRGKAFAYGRALLAAAGAFPLLAFAGFVPGVPAELQLVLVVALVGAPLAAVFLFPAALIADIVDDDETRTGLRREGLYFGTQNFVEKTATSFAPLLVAGLLALGSTADDPLGIRLVGPLAGLLLLAGWAAFRRYDLPDEARAPVAPR